MFKEIKDFPSYKINKYGVVINSRGKQLKPFKNVDGYYCIVLCSMGKRSHKRICRLVAEAFVPNPDNKPVVNHKNLVRDDDYFLNLEWVTTLENNLHGIENNIDAHRGAAVINLEQAHKICSLLQDGLRAKDISELLDVPLDSVNHISKGNTWTDVSNGYTFHPRSSRVSISTARWVISQLNDGKSYNDILSVCTNKRLTYNLIKMIENGSVYRELINEFNGQSKDVGTK